MSGTPEPMDTNSPEGSPPTTAILPPALIAGRANRDKARIASTELRKKFETKLREVEPVVAPNEQQPMPDPQASLELAELGIDLAHKEKETIQLERAVVTMERDRGMLRSRVAKRELGVLTKRYLSAGDDLWRHQKKKMRLGDPGVVRLLEPRGNALSECLLALYKKSDGQDKVRKRPSTFRAQSLAYYEGTGDYHGRPANLVHCHISGTRNPGLQIKAAHIVPHFLDNDSIGEMLFGSQAESLRQAGNSLLLLDQIKRWFDSYHLIVVPVDATENPITRWQTHIITTDLHGQFYTLERDAKDLHGKELVFLNRNRPVSRFLYFHFIMALVRIKDIKRRGWEDVWARYYEQRPFPTPGNYMRQSMLLALATHFETADMNVINSWIKDHGFDSPLQLTDDEATEAARRVHEASDAANSDTKKSSGEDSSEDDSSEDNSSEDEGSEGEGSEGEGSEDNSSEGEGSEDEG